MLGSQNLSKAAENDRLDHRYSLHPGEPSLAPAALASRQPGGAERLGRDPCSRTLAAGFGCTRRDFAGAVLSRP